MKIQSIPKVLSISLIILVIEVVLFKIFEGRVWLFVGASVCAMGMFVYIFERTERKSTPTQHIAKEKTQLQQLRQSAKFRKEFLSNVSHELKTPLFATEGFLEALSQEKKNLSKTQKKFLKGAKRNLKQLSRLVDDLLITSRIETGNIRFRHTPFDLRLLIEETLEDLQKEQKTKKIQTYLHTKHTELWVKADKKYIRQVISNLLHNAIRYNLKKGQIHITLSAEDTHAHIQIEDSGIGIPSKELTRIFERFYRVEKSRNQEDGGTGIGLALVKHILDAHGQSISVESRIGKGSCFSFSLPLSKSSSNRPKHLL